MNLHLKKVGLAGSVFTLLCCLGFGPLIAPLSAIGAVFWSMTRFCSSPEVPLLVVFLVIGGVGLGVTYRLHRHKGPLLAHVSGAVAVIVFTFVLLFAPLVWLGLAGLFAASFWDFVLGKRVHQAND